MRGSSARAERSARRAPWTRSSRAQALRTFDEAPDAERPLPRLLDEVDLLATDAHLGGVALYEDGVGSEGAGALRSPERSPHRLEEIRGHPSVPPTVMSSMRMVGRPTPTGTDWPSLPQVPTPASRARSRPSREPRSRTSGPFPISVAAF